MNDFLHDWLITLPAWVVEAAIVTFMAMIAFMIYGCLAYREEDWNQRDPDDRERP